MDSAGVRGAPCPDRVGGDGGEPAQRPVGQRPQRQQLCTGRGGGQRANGQLAPEEPNA